MVNVTDLYFSHFEEILYGGLLKDVPGHGGVDCVSYLNKKIMYLDSSFAALIAIIACIFAYKSYSLPNITQSTSTEPTTKKILLVILCVVLGAEVGYKCAAKKALYLLNPCHILTLTEVYLLSVKQSRTSTAILRLLIHELFCALIAMVLPETAARKLPGELSIYWIEHALVYFVVPPYLVYQWGVKSLESIYEFSWTFFSLALFQVYHFYVLQPLALLTYVNINYIICPATKDPFNGPYYRLAAVFHQTICVLTLGKLYTVILKTLIPKRKVA